MSYVAVYNVTNPILPTMMPKHGDGLWPYDHLSNYDLINKLIHNPCFSLKYPRDHDWHDDKYEFSMVMNELTR